MYMTNLTPLDEMQARIEDELPRVRLWTHKMLHRKDGIKPAVFYPGPVLIGSNLLEEIDRPLVNLLPGKALGIVPWRSAKTGDTWATMVASVRDVHGRTHLLTAPFYYWNTYGSIGLMHIMRHYADGQHQKVFTFMTSHCMLRYRDRMGLNLEGLDLITYMMSSISLHAARDTVYHGRPSKAWVCQDGVFFGDQNEAGYYVFRTFLQWDDLHPKDRRQHSEYWARMTSPLTVNY